MLMKSPLVPFSSSSRAIPPLSFSPLFFSSSSFPLLFFSSSPSSSLSLSSPRSSSPYVFFSSSSSLSRPPSCFLHLGGLPSRRSFHTNDKERREDRLLPLSLSLPVERNRKANEKKEREREKKTKRWTGDKREHAEEEVRSFTLFDQERKERSLYHERSLVYSSSSSSLWRRQHGYVL
ncbi:hypothetical protein CSUI_009510, partial [Cystoisospora suis]